MRIKRICDLCSSPFWAVTANSRYCGKACQKKAHSELQKVWRIKNQDKLKMYEERKKYERNKLSKK